MKFYPFHVLVPAVSAAVLLFVSCASEPDDERNMSSAYREGVPGGTWIESYKIPVTVAAVDPASRKVTLVASDNSRNTFTAGPEFKGFEDLRVGDHFEAAVARELNIFMRSDGEAANADKSVAKEMVKDGEFSDILKADRVEKIARVTAINAEQGKATLTFADGTTHEVSVRQDVNLWSMKPGGEVVIRTRSVAVLNLEKP